MDHDCLESCRQPGQRVFIGDCQEIPADLQGVAVHPEMVYVLVTTSSGQLLLVAVDRLPDLTKMLGDLEVVTTILGSDLCGTRYTHLFHPSSSNLPRPVILPSRHVTATSGTGLVHSAPAHGYEDYQAFGEAGLMPSELRSPIDDHGRFTDALLGWSDIPEVQELVGKEVLQDGTSVMIDILKQQKTLLAEETIEHRYPLDWKTSKPIIVRATPQWFADVENIKKPALQSLDRVAFVPPQCRCILYGSSKLKDSAESPRGIHHFTFRMVHLSST